MGGKVSSVSNLLPPGGIPQTPPRAGGRAPADQRASPGRRRCTDGAPLTNFLLLMRLGAVRAVCRVLLVAGAFAPAFVPLVTSPAAAAQADPVALAVEEAKLRLEQAQNEANEAAARFSEAESRYEQLGDEVAALEEKIRINEVRSANLRDITKRRAIVAYKTQGADVSAVFGSDDPREGHRSSVLLQAANSADEEAVAEYAVVADEMAADRERLAAHRKLQKEVLEKFADERRLLDAKVAESQQAMTDVEAKVRAAMAVAPGAAPVGNVSAPVIDGKVCPVPGAAFSNDYGAPRSGHSHQGNDMFAPTGTANLAVVSGNVTYGGGGSGGMGAYLEGEDGITYIYYHLSQYVGAPRHVTQGEVIAKLGSTGNAGAPHTHFEMRPGGKSASAINPYPTLTKIC